FVAGCRFTLDIAHVVADAADAEQAAFLAQLLKHLVQTDALLCQALHREDVELADAVVMEDAGLRRQSQAVGNTATALNGTDTATATQVAGDHPQRLAMNQFGRAQRDVPVTGPMEAVAADTEFFRPVPRNRVDLPCQRDGLVESGFKR